MLPGHHGYHACFVLGDRCWRCRQVASLFYGRKDHLFAEAEAGKRIVICMRSAYWGLDTGRKYAGALFAPAVSRSDNLIGGPEHDSIVEIVKQRIGG
jgi:hypothetical protein